MGHSYGTFVASRMIQMHGGRVHSVALIDPVCFGEPALYYLTLAAWLCGMMALVHVQQVGVETMSMHA